jgi:hypothetical protein
VERPWAELLVSAEPEVLPLVAVSANIESLHRMSREERDLHGVLVQGSDHLTAYNLYAEAVNKFGSVGEVYGLPRHLFPEELDDWAQGRGVLIKAIEDAAMGTASVYRSLELPLPARLPYAGRELRQRFIDLLARVHPFDVVIDERTSDGQPVRVAKTSVAGTWGAVTGTVRWFADRFGVPRASVEGTTIPYDLIGRYSETSAPEIVISGPRKHQQLAVSWRRSYAGFELDTEIRPIEGRIPEELLDQAKGFLARALLDGETIHPDQARVRKAAGALREWWRRSGGQLAAASTPALIERLHDQMSDVRSWKDFLHTPFALDAESLVAEGERHRLDALPGMIRLFGDAVPLEYEVVNGAGIVRLKLREGQARRLASDAPPDLDRPLRFAVVRGGESSLLADTIPELLEMLRQARQGRPHRHKQQRGDRRPRRGGRRR